MAMRPLASLSWSPPLPITLAAPATLAFFLFLEESEHTPAPGPLHLPSF